jgi:hypothetical protein
MSEMLHLSFPEKLYRILDDEDTDIIRWIRDGAVYTWFYLKYLLHVIEIHFVIGFQSI